MRTSLFLLSGFFFLAALASVAVASATKDPRFIFGFLFFGFAAVVSLIRWLDDL